jgi:hypothetical protein
MGAMAVDSIQKGCGLHHFDKPDDAQYFDPDMPVNMRIDNETVRSYWRSATDPMPSGMLIWGQLRKVFGNLRSQIEIVHDS